MTRKLTILILAMLFAIFGSGAKTWGADVTYTFTPDKATTGNSSTSYVTSAYSFTYNDIGWSFNQWNPSTLQIKTNQSSATSEFNFKNTSAFSGRIKSVVITFKELTVSNASGLCFVGGTSTISSLSGGSAGTWNNTAKTLTWTPAATEDFTFFAFYQNGKVASGNNFLAEADAIVITYEDSDTPSKTLESLAISGTPTKTTYETGDKFDPTGLVVTGTYDDESTANLTNAADWTFDPATFTLTSQTSVYVTATVGEIESEPFEVTGLTVTEFVQTYANTYTSDASLSSTITGSKVKWEGCKEPDGYNALKIAKASTANIAVPAGTKTVHLHMVAWNGESAAVTVKLGSNTLPSITPTADAGVSGSGTTYTIATEPKTENSYYFAIEVNTDEAATLSLTTASSKRAILFGVNFEAASTKTLTSIAIKTAPTKTTYNVGETFAPAGLVITATYDDESTEDIAYTGNESKFTFNPELTTALTTADNKVTITYGGISVDQAITVNLIKLATPENLEATNVTPTSATLSWNAVEHASSYTVYVTGINYEETFEPTTNSIDLNNLTAGTEYLWTVKAIGDEVTYLDSQESELAGFTTPTTVLYNIVFETQQTGGTIEFYPEQAEAGEEVIAIATAANHYSFTRWNFSPAVTIYDGEDTDYNIIFIMPDSDVTVSATFTEDTKYTVTYAKGGDDVTGEDPETVSYYENDEVTLKENPYTRTGYTFYRWEVKDADENTQYLDENATFVMPASNVTVTPYWYEKDPATITLMDKGAQYGETINGFVGDNLLATLTAAGVENPTGLATMPDYEFAGWAQSNSTETPNIATEETTITGNATLYAIYANVIPGTSTWDLVTNASHLAIGDVVVIAASGSDYAMSTTQNTNNRGQFAITKTDSQVTWNNSETDGVQEITLETGSKNNTFAFNVGDVYLYAASSSSNYLKTQDEIDDNASWAISISENVASIVAQGTNTRNVMQYNQSSSLFACYGSASQKALALYKENTTPGTTIYDFEESAKIYTVTYDANGAEGDVPVEAMLFAQGDEYTLASAEGLTKEHHTFAGWKANTDEQTYAVGSTYTFGEASVIFTAQWDEEQKLTISYHTNGVVSSEDVFAGENQLTAPANVPNGYTYVGWAEAPIEGVAQTATYFSSYNVTEDVDLYAVFAIATKGGNSYRLSSTAPVAGDNVIVAGKKDSKYYALWVDNTTVTATELTINNGIVTNYEGLVWNASSGIQGVHSGIVLDNGTNPLHMNNSGLKVASSNQNGTFEFPDSGDGFKIYGNQNTRWMTFNGTTFGVTSEEASASTLYFFMPDSFSNFCTTVSTPSIPAEITGNVTIPSGAAYTLTNPITIKSDATLTINGVLGNADASLLIINDGGQLIHHNAGVNATVKKNITGYTGDNDNYYLIANPTDNATVANLINPEGYDLYTFNPAGDEQGREWINEKANPLVESEKGYLYANSGPTTTLEFAGELTPASETEVTLVKATAGTGTGIDFPGFNLIGNPYACNAYPTDGNGIFMSYYKMNEDGNELELVENIEAVTPCEGFFFEAAENNQKIYLTTETPATVPSLLNISVSQNRGSVIDRAIVSFDGRSNLHKFMLNPAHTNISIAKGGETFAAVSTEAEGEMPVNFKAEKNGTYTITVNTENVEANYLHLIDNMTGADTDLLSTSSYTFDAKTSDYASRFKLVFGVKNDNEEMSQASSFAYINNGEIVISNEGRATLQVIDVLGRIISSEEINGEARISTNGLTAGLYILNLNGMTQKIVVR